MTVAQHYDSRHDTHAHIAVVRGLLLEVVKDLLDRAHHHDESKLVSPEVEAFDEYTPFLRSSTFGSEEYERSREAMGPALHHHYNAGRHHPEAFARGVRGMTLVDLLEMTVDWVAAAQRHDDGDVRASVDKLQERFRFGDELREIFLNTIDAIESA